MTASEHGPSAAGRAEAAEPARDTLTWATLVAGCLGVCVAQIALAMPATLNGLFQEEFHPIGSQLTWISDAFLLPTAVLELSFGVIGDLFGRRRLLVAGGLFVLVGAVVAATAHGIHVLWLAQALTGLGAAALFPSTLAAIAAGTPRRAGRARGIAYWSGSLSLGALIAPLLGGITGNAGSWRAAFVVLAVAGALVAVISCFATESSAPEGRSLDWGGQITIAVGLFALLYAVIEGETAGWGSAPVVGGFVAAAVFIALFVWIESRVSAPMLHLDVFRSPSFSAAAAVALIGLFAYLGTAYSISIRMGPVQHQSPLRNAVPFIILNGVTPICAPLFARLLQRMDPRWMLGVGLVFMAGGDFWLATLPISDTTITSLVGPFVCTGIGFAFIITAITAAAVNTVPIGLAGMASGATSMLRDFGQTLGPAIIGTIALGSAASRFQANLPSAHLSPHDAAAVHAIAGEGGPLAVVSAPPAHPAAHVAVEALGHGYAIGFLVCGIAALAAAAISVLLLRGHEHSAAAEGEAVPAPAH